MESKEQLKKNFNAAADAYVDALLDLWSDHDKEDPAYDPKYGWWVSDDRSGVYCYGDEIFINLSDIIYCVENDITFGEFTQWQDYCVACHQWNFDTPNLRSWHEGCPRIPQETFDKLEAKKKELEDLVEETKSQQK